MSREFLYSGSSRNEILACIQEEYFVNKSDLTCKVVKRRSKNHPYTTMKVSYDEEKKLTTWREQTKHYDATACSNIIQYFKTNASHFWDEDEYIQCLENEADIGNIEAMKELAHCYQAGVYVSENDELSKQYLENIVNSDIGHWTIHILKKCFNEISPSCSYQDMKNAKLFGNTVGSAHYQLGLLCLSSAKTLNDAKTYFMNANICDYNCSHELEALKEKILFLESIRLKDKSFPTDSRIFRDLKIEDEKCVSSSIIDKLGVIDKQRLITAYLKDEYKVIKEALIREFRKDNWDKLAYESQIALITGMFCYNQMYRTHLGESEKFDYSATVNPLMKSLEYELKSRFYLGYIKFLKKNYPKAINYLYKNGIIDAEGDLKIELHKNQNRLNERKTIIWFNCDHKEVDYINLSRRGNEFTLGTFKFSTGIDELKKPWGNKVHPDLTMLEYCSRMLFKRKAKNRRWENDEISEWLIQLCTSIEWLKRLRNRAAHGGEMISVEEAQNCWDEIIIIKRLLCEIVEVCCW